MVDETLDREEMSRHLLTVMVRDQGVPSKKSFARVVIDVDDDNDHAPRFLSSTFEGRVFETAAIGSSVVQVVAMDQDKGSNSELAYSILSGLLPLCVSVFFSFFLHLFFFRIVATINSLIILPLVFYYVFLSCFPFSSTSSSIICSFYAVHISFAVSVNYYYRPHGS